MTSTEVNFEKRGRLTDHQPCPVCGACKCDKHTHKLMLIVVFLLLLFTTSVHAQEYTFTMLDYPFQGVPGTIVNTRATAISNGKVAGSWQAYTVEHPSLVIISMPPLGFLWDKGEFSELKFPGATSTQPSGISPHGVVVGVEDQGRAFIYQPGKGKSRRNTATWSILNFPPALNTVNANGISAIGEIVGSLNITLPNGRFKEVGFIRDNDQANSIVIVEPSVSCDRPDLFYESAISASGINRNGWVVGWVFCGYPTSQWMAWVTYDFGDTFFIFNFPGAEGATVASGIDDDGRIAGHYWDEAANARRGFILDGEFKSVQIGRATQVNGISRGEVVGEYTDSSLGSHGFIAIPAKAKGK